MKKLIKKSEIKSKPLRFILGLIMLSMPIYLLFNIQLIVALFFGFYPLYISINLFFQSFGYDPFNRITNTPY